MIDFERFKAAVALLAYCAASADDFEQLTLALLRMRTDNPFHDLDYLAYMTDLQNAITGGIEATTAVIDGMGGNA